MAPNPSLDGFPSLYVNLQGPAVKLRVLVFTESMRKVGEAETTAGSGGGWLGWVLPLEAGKPLANGSYGYLVESYGSEGLADQRAGFFFVLK